MTKKPEHSDLQVMDFISFNPNWKTRGWLATLVMEPNPPLSVAIPVAES